MITTALFTKNKALDCILKLYLICLQIELNNSIENVEYQNVFIDIHNSFSTFLCLVEIYIILKSNKTVNHLIIRGLEFCKAKFQRKVQNYSRQY